MAFISREDDEETFMSNNSDSTIPPSFITATDDDPFLTRAASVIYPDVRRNILVDINNAENTVLPPPTEKESLKVFLRVKPKTQDEAEIAKAEGHEEDDIVKIESEYQIALTAPKESKAYKNSINGVGKMMHRYTFTKIFDPDIGQKEIFSNVVLPRLKDFLEGQNQLLFTYGATSAGKTFTIQGTPEDPGLMPLALDTLFSTIEGKVSSTVPLRPIGYNRVVSASQSDLARIAKERENVFKLGLELLKQRRSPVNCHSANSSKLSQVSTASTMSTGGMSMDSLDLSELHQLFPSLSSRNRSNASKLDIKDSSITYTVWISFAEIYNECVYDLLQKIPEAKKKGEKAKRPVLKLSEDKDGSTFIKDINEIQVSSADEAYQALMIGRENLQFAATKLNHQSSRSHCIFTVKLIRVADPDKPHLARVSMLSFCDLAGSERISKTQNVGKRLKEAGNINTSLLVLGRCIKTIRLNQNITDSKKNQIVPFRESKLTRLIKTFFSGLGKASLVVCVSQAPYLFDESVHVMKFASIASKVTVEQYKEPVVAPAQRRTTRFSSIIAGGKKSFANSILSGRGSIAWEPSSRSTLLPDFTKGCMIPPSFAPSARSTICPRPKLTELSEGNESAEDNDDTVVESEQYHALLELVDDLKNKLLEERKKNKTLEVKVRAELCDEFNKLLVDVEEGYEDRLERERERAKETSEWRINELQKAYNKGGKRKRSNSSSGFDGLEMKIACLENKVEEEEKESQNLREQLNESENLHQALKDTVKSTNEAKDRLQEQNSTLQFQLAEQQRLAAETGRELAATKSRLDNEQKLNMDKLESEETQISELKIQVTKLRNDLAQKEEECADMKDLLQEAGDEFLAKQEEVDKIHNNVKELENQVTQQSLVLDDVEGQLEESHVLLREVNNQLDDKETKVEEMEESIETLKETVKELNESKLALVEQLQIQTEKSNTADKFLVDVRSELSETAKEVERLKTESSQHKVQALQQEKQELLASRTKLMEELAELKSDKLSSSQEIEVNIYLDELKNDLKKAEKTNTELSKEIEVLKTETGTLRDDLDAARIQLDEANKPKDVDESMFDDNDDEMMRLRNEVTALTDDKLRLTQEQEVLVHEQETLLKEQEEQKEVLLKLEEELRRTKTSVEKSEISILETRDFELEEKIVVKEQESEELRKQVATVKHQLQQAKNETESLETTLEEQRQLLTTTEKTRQQEMDKLKLENNKKIEDLQNRLDSTESSKESSSREMTDLKSELSSLQDKLSACQTDLSAKLEQLSTLEVKNTELTSKVSNRDALESQMEEMKSIKSELEAKSESLAAELAEVQGEAEKVRLSLTAELADAQSQTSTVKAEAESVRLESEKTKSELEDRISAMTDKLNESKGNEGSSVIIELEGRAGSLEKELSTKENYIRDLEDIIVEKEFRISELEKEVPDADTVDSGKETVNNLLKKVKKVEEESARSEQSLNDDLEAQRVDNKKLRLQIDSLRQAETDAEELKSLRKQVAELQHKISQQGEEVDWKEKLRAEREQLDQHVSQLQLKVNTLQAKEDEIGRLNEETASLRAEKTKVDQTSADLNNKLNNLTRNLKENQDEIRVLKRATKHSAVEAQELQETKDKSASLEKELERVSALLEARTREDGALDLLREEIGSKGEEVKRLTENIEYLKATEQAKDYEIKKTKDDRDNLMAHYESMFKKKQAELESIKSRNNEGMKLQEVMAKATPTKTNSQVKDLSQRLQKCEEENTELKSELAQLQKLQDESRATHEREMRRLKKASELVVAEYRETNNSLQKQIVSPSRGSSRSGVSIHVTDVSTLEADDSKSESSFIEVTPVVKRSGRGRSARGRSNRSNLTRNSSLASFEDSNTENEPELGSRSKVGRKPRVARGTRKNVSFQEEEEVDRSGSRKRALKEKQLSPVRETKKPSLESDSDRDFVTPGPIDRKKRRLYSTTPQVAEVFTPPTDSECVDSPHSVVKRQLRSRRQSRK